MPRSDERDCMLRGLGPTLANNIILNCTKVPRISGPSHDFHKTAVPPGSGTAPGNDSHHIWRASVVKADRLGPYSTSHPPASAPDRESHYDRSAVSSESMAQFPIAQPSAVLAAARLVAFPQLRRRPHRDLSDLSYSGGYTITTDLQARAGLRCHHSRSLCNTSRPTG